MARWEPDARGRLQAAAMSLFVERGFADVTVADIADRAGLTKRTFFNHFDDKREVLFADAAEFERDVVSRVARPGPDTTAMASALRALADAGEGLRSFADSAALRRDLIASSRDLQERNLIKMTSLGRAVAAELETHGADRATAAFAASAAIEVFTHAYDRWADDTSLDFHVLIGRSLATFRQATAG